MNRNYHNGRNHEYRLAAKLRKEGWVVIRAAGSHGLFDLIAIKPPPEGEMFLIQAKSGASAERERARALKDIETFTGTYQVKAVVE